MFKKRKHEYNPIVGIAILMNQYHSIEMMCGTKEEKEWARKRLEKRILKKAECLSDKLITQLKVSMKSKGLWEEIKNQYL